MPIFGKNKKDDKNQNLPAEEAEKKIPAEQSAEPAEPAAPAEPAEPEIPAISSSGSMADAAPAAAAPERPKYQTPEGFDFNRYFLAERRVVLENISYETQRPAAVQGQFKLNVKDTIVAQLIGQAGVKCTYNRTLRFEPEGPFVLSVSFAVMLVFNPGTRGEIDWHTIDVAEEFKKNCPQLVQTMMAKASLLVAEITNANGGVPIIPMR